MSAPVVVAEFATEFEATLAQEILSAAGIESAIQTDTFAPYILRPTWRLAVSGAEVAEANRLLAPLREQPE